MVQSEIQEQTEPMKAALKTLQATLATALFLVSWATLIATPLVALPMLIWLPLGESQDGSTSATMKAVLTGVILLVFMLIGYVLRRLAFGVLRPTKTSLFVTLLAAVAFAIFYLLMPMPADQLFVKIQLRGIGTLLAITAVLIAILLARIGDLREA